MAFAKKLFIGNTRQIAIRADDQPFTRKIIVDPRYGKVFTCWHSIPQTIPNIEVKTMINYLGEPLWESTEYATVKLYRKYWKNGKLNIRLPA